MALFHLLYFYLAITTQKAAIDTENGFGHFHKIGNMEFSDICFPLIITEFILLYTVFSSFKPFNLVVRVGNERIVWIFHFLFLCSHAMHF